MRNKRRASQVLWIECIGFAILLAVSWLDELIRLPQLIFGGVAVPNWHESALESLVIITVWVFVFVGTRRILKRFYYLEDQLQMCGWCRKNRPPRFRRAGPNPASPRFPCDGWRGRKVVSD